MATAASSTSPNNETVTLKLPTGEMVDAIVPPGLADADVKSYVQMKRPDLFGAPAGGAASAPGAPSQQNVNFANPLPTENIPIAGAMAQPFGEVGASLAYDPKFRQETGKNAAIAAGAAGSAMAAPVIGAAGIKAGKLAWPMIKGTTKGVVGFSGAEALLRSAKQAPIIGDYVSKIPGIDSLPFLVGMLAGGSKGEPAPENPGVFPGAPYPEAPPPELSQAGALMRGGQQALDPAEGLGQIPLRGTPAPVAAPPVSNAAAGKQLDSSLQAAVGNRPLQPGVSLRNQYRAPVASAPVGGMTPVEGSSAVKAFRYDQAANELHVQTPDGTTYVSGEVTPDQAETFRDADSPGRAWKAIRDNSPLVAKILPGGNRIAMKGASALRSAGPGDFQYLNDPESWNKQNKF